MSYLLSSGSSGNNPSSRQRQQQQQQLHQLEQQCQDQQALLQQIQSHASSTGNPPTAKHESARERSRRQVKHPPSYTEPSLNTKLRKGDVCFPKVAKERTNSIRSLLVSCDEPRPSGEQTTSIAGVVFMDGKSRLRFSKGKSRRRANKPKSYAEPRLNSKQGDEFFRKAEQTTSSDMTTRRSARSFQQIQSLTLQPKPPPPANKYTEAFFQEWLDQNKTKLEPLLPQLDKSKLQFFQAACQHVQDCTASLKDAEAKRDEISKHKPVDQKALDKANKVVDDAKAALTKAQSDAQDTSHPLLDALEDKKLDDSTWQLLIATNVLVEGTPKGLAAYCASTTDDKAKALVQLIQDKRDFELLESMVLAGGARHGKYGPALELYNQLQAFVIKDANEKLWQRMALAVALEFADPLQAFRLKGTFIDPIHRYQHYQQAYQFGELDPVFSTEFGVWELRMALNSVAPDEQLSWGREMLKNYRPDLMQLGDKWRYCRIVRTDVFYTGHPNWDPTVPLDFKQVLSGGGECGPRAWMGRFICRAFGIPTWGVREPGHAAMARWTADQGWQVCLGAPMQWAWWEDECGLHFQAKAAARKLLQKDAEDDEKAYGQKVGMLEWIANVEGEPADQVVRGAVVDPKAIWRSLSLMQMRRLVPPPPSTQDDFDLVEVDDEVSEVEEDVTSTPSECPPLVPQLEKLKLRNCTITEQIATLPSGTIIIPATTCTTKPSKNVMFMDSFLGGKQLFLDKDGHAEYTLVSPPVGKYQMTCHIVTVHDDKVKPPLLVTIDSGDEDDDGVLVELEDDNSRDNLCSVYSIPLQCTWGMWEETKPVVVELPSGVTSCQIAISREATAHGLVIKDLKLVPVKGN